MVGFPRCGDTPVRSLIARPVVRCINDDQVADCRFRNLFESNAQVYVVDF